ncbi:hypothetical protein COY87_04780 [Candidatus Roizmanbacteria bacterium CG_4_10_14_0_8_um_filter_33_9]|uniref:Uncharacterized protein n=1 Tax=Candidatus Roizmanbacteria bacterium CG_4_10_14_0_8_um_filter_33_9 TaxID=1974826 RepID=A0A2M7QHA3_9BACT|nr:MAG: hypothetical protein COY87_04780 [Candidatus Roizmanbacteria bacterium CG_4_10_14_0_8_um_filter_33_9]
MSKQEKKDTYENKLALTQAMVQLDSKEKEIKTSQGYGKAYFLSIIIPPIGIYYFVKYVFFTNGEDTSTKAGIISLILTLISFFFSLWMMTELLKQLTSSLPSQNLQQLNELTIPDNQKKLLEIFK